MPLRVDMRRVVKKAVAAPRVAGHKTAVKSARATARQPVSDSISLTANSTTTDAFKTIAAALLARIASQKPGVAQHDPTAVHQMRIALRRMRVVITIFAPLVHGPETERLKRELKWLTGRLGPARDLHLMDLKLRETDGAGSPAFRKRVAADRASAFATAGRAVTDKRFDKLLADLQQWVEAAGQAQTAQEVPARAKTFAKRTLKRRAKRLIRKLDRLDELNDEQRHRVRIAAKKLYYTAGFFEGLFDGHKSAKPLAKFSKRLKKLLDALGALNDAAVQRDLATNVANRSGLSAKGDGKVKQAAKEAAEDLAAGGDSRDAQLKAALKVARRLADAPIFGD
ncbi:CHAD domain-containing protein [Rhodopseudomonas sp. HC1]|uniref:CHAD domain-containing protein n=1 Tax=Rhodopseudomonas infernalis TaxID=2897386 RepID=UPI001EE80258|nr:CHAD domain-containing protein [Rhodopseudomonas infernalis]MCG6205143.1 CHAD domain-containing protein [Rhodopseudomonas infernalis]